jgi:8-oxo-dGTP pyrophosphatase MutT (NUDIX family)
MPENDAAPDAAPDDDARAAARERAVVGWIRDAERRGITSTGVEAAPAATVVLLRDGEAGVEVLLARRAATLEFHGGAWVFPGGRIDPDDYRGDPSDVLAAARRAAVREASEECAMTVDHDTLVHLANWTTPEIAPKRFATWFFVARASDDDLVADGGETTEVRWFQPGDALAARERGDIELAPPQYVSLLLLDGHADVDATLAAVREIEPFDVTPRFARLDDGTAICIYDDDVAYDDLDVERPGHRHRLWMRPTNVWTYERD